MDTTTPTATPTPLRQELHSFKSTFDPLLVQFITEETIRFSTISSNRTLNTLFTHLTDVCAGGKRLRPFMVYTMYRHAHPDATVEDLKDILLAVELFHIFCLIHDDVMDEAPLRHGVPTLQQFAKAHLYHHTTTPHCTRISESQAILVGDVVFNIVFRLINSSHTRSLPHHDAVQAVFHTLVDEVCIGQMLDVDLTARATATLETITEKNRLKTAYYSFARPLHIGAIIAERSDLVPFVLTFGEAMGLLYQIQDDLLDIASETIATQKETFQDITQNQHTILTAYVRTHGGAAASLLEQKVGTTLTKEDKAALRAAFEDAGAIAHAQALIAHYTHAAETAITSHELNDSERILMTSLLSLLIARHT